MPFKKGQSGNPGGRPKGPQFKDYVSEKEIKELVALAKKQAKEKPELLKFVLEQVFGKAPQNLNVGGQDNNPLMIKVIRYGEDNQTPQVPGSGDICPPEV